MSSVSSALTPAMVARGRTLAPPRLSPDGRLLAWVEGVCGRADLVVAPVDGSGPPVVVTADAAASASGGFTWADGGRQLVYAAGDGRLVAVPATGGPLRCLSRDGRASAPAASPDGSRMAFVLEREDACEIAAVPLDGSSWPARVSTSADWSLDPAWSADGRLLAWHEWDFPDMPWDASRIVVRPVEGTAPSGPPEVVAGGDGVACGQPRFSPDGSSLAFICDRTGWMNVWVTALGTAPDRRSARPLLEEAYEHAEPTWGGGQRSFAWSPDGTSVVLCRNEAGFGRLVVVGRHGGTAGRGAGAPTLRRSLGLGPQAGRRSRQDTAEAPAEIGTGWHHGLDWGSGAITALRSGVRTPPQVVVLQPDGSGRRSLAQGPANAVAAAGPIEPEAVTWESDDGGTVHGLFYRPAASALGPGTLPPLLVYVHGGPTGMAAAAWFPRHQFWLSRGWAVLTPNYRGSSGYGRAYTQALTGRWGELDVGDVAAGIRHAGRSGWADPDRVALDGGSAGGFTLLLVCARHPGLIRAAVERYGVADLFHLAETTHRYESRYTDRLVGPLPAAADHYRERSPVNWTEKIAVPLLVLQGDKDEVVPKAQSDAVVDALRRREVPVEYHVYEGEGHGWSRPETVADELERADRFLTRWVLKR